MIKSQTLFVLGAGASCEVNFPSGDGLKEKISKLLNIQFQDGLNQSSGDRDILLCLREFGSQSNVGINEILKSAVRIRDGMPYAISIDNFLDAHSDNKNVELCGKLAIVQSILNAERASHIYYDESNRAFKSKSEVAKTWYPKFFQIISENISKEKSDTIFDNIGIISFKYDRTIEHYLYRALQDYYGMDSNQSASVMNRLRIYHPYGTIGKLSWMEGGRKIDFGGTAFGSELSNLSSGIKTFTERYEDKLTLESMHSLVSSSEKIVFLGFAYHSQNMQLLSPPPYRGNCSILGTGLGISDSELAIVEQEIYTCLKPKSGAFQATIRNTLTCSELFNQYPRFMSS